MQDTRVKSWTVLLLAAVTSTVLVQQASAAPARLVQPLDWGTVDFGDQMSYRLEGPRCFRDRVVVQVRGGSRGAAVGPVSKPMADPLEGGCVGKVTVPSEKAVRKTGWDAGDLLDIRIVSRHDDARLVPHRLEVEHGKHVVGAPIAEIPPVRDPRGGAKDKALSMSTGDVVSLGRIDLTNVYSVSFRVCVSAPKPHLSPSLVELRAGGPNGTPILGPIDVNDDANNANKSSFGFPNCWQLQPWPITNYVPGRAPQLFLAMVATATPVHISSLDFNGTGAVKVPERPAADPPGTVQLFDGTSLKGWTTRDCEIEEDYLRIARTNDPANYGPPASYGFVGGDLCVASYTAKKFHNAMIRLEYRMQDFGDNGGVHVGNGLQMREAGEFLTGGLFGTIVPDAVTSWMIQNAPSGYPSERIMSNAYPHWSQMEVVQLGSRYTVRVNGRTIVDCNDCVSDPGPWNLGFDIDPQHSWQYDVGYRMDTGPTNPTLEHPHNWANLHFRNVRAYECKGLKDPVCLAGPGLRG